MKKILVLSLAVVTMFCSCNNAKKSTTKSSEKATVSAKVELKAQNNANTVTELFAIAEDNVGKEVSCLGKVDHVCQHSGRRCFIADKEGNSIKVEAGDKIKTFPKDLMEKNICVKGTLQMTKIDKKKIDEMAKEHEHCDTESTNVKKMREWMKKHNKDYYAFYFINCIEYKEIK